jgi:hypothetical protein
MHVGGGVGIGIVCCSVPVIRICALSLLPDVDEGCGWINHRVPYLFDAASIPPSEWSIELPFFGHTVFNSEESSPCSPDVRGWFVLMRVVEDGLAWVIIAISCPFADFSAAAVTDVR